MTIQQNYLNLAETIYTKQKPYFVESLAKQIQASIKKGEQDIQNGNIMDFENFKKKLRTNTTSNELL